MTLTRRHISAIANMSINWWSPFSWKITDKQYTIKFNNTGLQSAQCPCSLTMWWTYPFRDNNQRYSIFRYAMSYQSINPILTGGGGQFDPPLHEIRDCLATAADRDTPFHDFFLSSLAHLLIPSLRKSDHRSRGHVTFCTRTSAQNLPKICILHRFVYKTHGNYWFS